MLTLFPFASPIVFIIIVVVLGLMTPGYNHINYTISRLAIEKYGWIQSLNFLQLALGLFLTGNNLTARIKDKTADVLIRTSFRICSVFLVIAAAVPTDPIENVPLDVTLLTPTGLVHISMVVIFLILSPIGIVRLSDVLRKEPRFATFASLTLIAGFTALVGGIVWFVFYFAGIYLEYRGIFQKVIALPVMLWFILINYAVNKKAGNETKGAR